MATARVPRPEAPGPENVLNPQIITIGTSLVPSVKACIIANGQQVTFVNSSGLSNIQVTFEPDANAVNGWVVFNNFSIASYSSPNNQVTQSPQVNNRTVNFAITPNGVTPTDYPFAIQVGNGPLYIHVYYINNEVNCYPSPAVIPAGGALELYKNANDPNTYNVNWPVPSNPFTPALTSVDGASHTENAGVNSYNYTVTMVAANLGIGKGGGTVVVK